MFTVQIMGRLGADPEIKTLTDNTRQVANLRVAVNTSQKTPNGNYRTEWCDVSVWGSTAEFVGRHFTKGDGIVLDGEVRSVRTYRRRDDSVGASIAIEAHRVFFPVGGLSDSSDEESSGDDGIPF